MLCKMNVMARNVLLYLQKCCFMWNFTTNSSSHIHQYSLYYISELTWNKPLNCQVFTTSASSPEGRAPVRRKATTKWTGRATWRPTLPGYGSTWASLAGSCTTGRIPTWPGWLTTWQRSASSVLVSKWGAGGGWTGERTDWRRDGVRGEPPEAKEGYAVRRVEDHQWYHHSVFISKSKSFLRYDCLSLAPWCEIFRKHAVDIHIL